MKIGVVSDTHRNRDYLDRAADWLIQKQKIATLYHLGDDYEDVVDLGGRYIELVQVPGIYNPRYRDGSLAPKAFEMVQGVRVLLVHCLEKDMTEEDSNSADIILYGHTHKAELKLEDGKLYMNPGHLKGEKDKTMPASFGMLDIQSPEIRATIFGMDFEVVESLDMVQTENGLYRAT